MIDAIEIRDEQPGDVAAIRDVNLRAFGQPDEANIVDALRAHGAVMLSLVATMRIADRLEPPGTSELRNPRTLEPRNPRTPEPRKPGTTEPRVVAHIMFSAAVISDVIGAGLAPMAVVPDCQRQGIGSRLVEDGLRRLKDLECPFVIVLGHPEFYPRFGFTPASRRGIRCEWDVRDEVFMLLVLDEAKMHGATGLARYRPEFSSAS